VKNTTPKLCPKCKKRLTDPPKKKKMLEKGQGKD
jgi:hypothetical protein